MTMQLSLIEPPEITLPPLRDYQVRLVNEVYRVMREHKDAPCSERRILIVLPTGGGKCVSPDTLVWSDGLKRFGDAWGAKKIAGFHNTDPVVGWYDDKINDGYVVKAANGFTIDGTFAHRIWIRDASGYEGWRRTDEVKIGDFVGIARGRADFGSTDLKNDDAYLLGLLVADGCILEKHEGATFCLQIDKQRPVMEAISPTLSRWIGMAESYFARSSHTRKGCVHITDVSDYHAFATICNPGIPSLLASFGLSLPSSLERVVPDSVLTGTRRTISSFLRGYFDGDGYCDHNNVRVSTGSKLLAEQVCQLLIGLGIACSIKNRNTDSGNLSWIVTIFDVEAFATEVGFTSYGLKKDIAFSALLSAKRNTNIDTIPGIGSLLRSAAQNIPGKHLRLDEWRHVDAYYSSKKKPSYNTLKNLLVGISPERSEYGEIERIIRENRFWSEVVSITPSRTHRIDCEVGAEEHAFIGNGMVNHNTITIMRILVDALLQGRRGLGLVPLTCLVRQTYDTAKLHGVEPGVIAASFNRGRNPRPSADLQIASTDTLVNRDIPRDVSIVWADEGHSNLYVKGHRHLTALNDDGTWKHWRPDAWLIGCTASPWRTKKTESLDEIYKHVVVGAQPSELMEIGKATDYHEGLVPAVYYGFGKDKQLNLDGVGSSMGDFAPDELSIAVDNDEVTLNLIEQWEALCVRDTLRASRRTIFFGSSIDHSMHVADAVNAYFREKALAENFKDGMIAKHLDGDAPMEEREYWFERISKGEILWLCSVDILSTGFDQPTIECVIPRPTKSLVNKTQQEGRGLRCAPWIGKKDCYIIDIGRNSDRYGLISDTQNYDLKPPKEKGKGEAPVKQCPECDAIINCFATVCPECGYQFPSKEKEKPSGELVVLVSKESKFYAKLAQKAFLNGYSPGYAMMKYKEKYGKFPSGEFKLHAVFAEPKPGDMKDYWQYLRNMAAMKGKDEKWCRRFFRDEFGLEYSPFDPLPF